MYKRFILIGSFIFLSVFSYSQEASYGITAGYFNANLDNSAEAYEVSDEISGFYIGALSDIAFNESIHLVLGANYAISDEADFLFIPLLAQYYIVETDFYLQAGPQASFIFAQENNATFNTLGIDAAIGAGYQINDNLFVNAKYAIELTDRLSRIVENGNLKLNSLMAGLGYRF